MTHSPSDPDSGHNSGPGRISYKDSGVDIDAGDDLVARIAPAARATARRGANAALGGFGGLFDVKEAGFNDPLLVAATDGVGTKLKLAIEVERFDTIGQDLVAMCVNDIVVQGAEPLFFLDYYASAALNVDQAAVVVEGIARACKESGCALIGGETAEMPGLYAKGDFDLAGFAVGAVERGAVLPRMHDMREGDCVIGVASSGVHSNGFSLVRKVIAERGHRLDAPAPFAPENTLADILLTPTQLYVKSALGAIHAGVHARGNTRGNTSGKHGGLRGFVHITGSGISGNLPRVLPEGLDAEIDLSAWRLPAVFAWLAREAALEDAEMLRTFNCGIGFIAIVDESMAGAVIDAFQELDQRATRIGTLIKARGDETRCVYRGALTP